MTAVAADTPPTMTAPPLRVLDHPLARVTYADTGQGRPALVDVVTQPLHEARAPVSEWVA